MGIGEEGYGRLLAMGSLELANGYLSGALEGQVYDGPWTDIKEDVEKINSLLKIGGGNDVHSWSATAMYYDNDWNSADQIPDRAVSSGLVDEFGSIDSTLGGNTRRASLSGQYSHQHESHRSEWRGYVIDSELDLWSNFTYLLDDPVEGDQFRQRDDRTIFGGSYSRFWVSGLNNHFHHRMGAEVRYDDIDTVGLYRTRDRRRIGIVREDAVEQGSSGLFYELDWRFATDWRAVLGIRGDYYRFDVDAGEPVNGGDDSDSIVSPKASLIYAFSDTSEAYLSGGYGFHSNDARGVTARIDPVSGEAVSSADPLVESKGAEFGFKGVWLDSWNASLALWYLERDSELLFVGDAGTTEASRPSERWGVELNNFLTLNEIWSLEVDLAWTDAKFSDSAPEGDDIPSALEYVATGAISARYPSGWFGSFRIRFFGDAPLVEDGSVESDGSTIANLALGWSNNDWRLQVDVLNMFDSDDHDIDYFYASRLQGEPQEGVQDMHYHIFEPRQVRVYLTRNF